MDIHQVQDTADMWRFLANRGLTISPLEPGMAPGSDPALLVFGLGTLYYSIPVNIVRGIQPLEKYIPLPFTHPYILGLVNVHGQNIVALDIRPLLHHETLPFVPSLPPAGASLLVVQLDGTTIGLLCDVVVTANHQVINQGFSSEPGSMRQETDGE